MEHGERGEEKIPRLNFTTFMIGNCFVYELGSHSSSPGKELLGIAYPLGKDLCRSGSV